MAVLPRRAALEEREVHGNPAEREQQSVEADDGERAARVSRLHGPGRVGGGRGRILPGRRFRHGASLRSRGRSYRIWPSWASLVLGYHQMPRTRAPWCRDGNLEVTAREDADVVGPILMSAQDGVADPDAQRIETLVSHSHVGPAASVLRSREPRPSRSSTPLSIGCSTPRRAKPWWRAQAWTRGWRQNHERGPGPAAQRVTVSRPRSSPSSPCPRAPAC